MFYKPPSDSTLSGFGLTSDDFEEDPVYAWPENEAAAKFFRLVANQWRMGPGGPYAIDYNTLFAVMDRSGVQRAEQMALLEKVRVMEDAALTVLLEKK